jgi:glycosyltransferase involved in cell wall biosynthesis
MEKLFIISNESIFNYEGSFYCDNIEIKSTPEGLNNKFEVHLIGRTSKKIRSHKINLNKIKIYSNLISYVFGIFNSLRAQNAKYLVVTITPFTFLACVIINIFKKKPIVYLISDGYKQYKIILGFFGLAAYHLMFSLVSKISILIGCREHLLRNKKGETVAPSQISSQWLTNRSEGEINKIKLLYVGRIRKEKGVFSLLELIKDNKINLSLSIVGAEKNSSNPIVQENVHIHELETNEKNLIKFYDEHSIFVLPSYTEGHPMALLESLSRLRPIIIFKEIEHVIGNKKGIFIAERNSHSLIKTINHIKENYKNIHQDMKENTLPTKEQFLKNFSKIISSTD